VSLSSAASRTELRLPSWQRAQLRPALTPLLLPKVLEHLIHSAYAIISIFYPFDSLFPLRPISLSVSSPLPCRPPPRVPPYCRMDSLSLPPQQMWDAAGSPDEDGLAGSGNPVASSASREPILDNGSSLVVNEAASTGGSGVYARPMQGLDQEVTSDLWAKLNAMYLSRKLHVEEAGFNSVAGRRTAAIMKDNPATVASRSVAVLKRLCDGVSADAAFQRVRLRRLNGVPGAASAAPDRVGVLAIPCPLPLSTEQMSVMPALQTKKAATHSATEQVCHVSRHGHVWGKGGGHRSTTQYVTFMAYGRGAFGSGWPSRALHLGKRVVGMAVLMNRPGGGGGSCEQGWSLW